MGKVTLQESFAHLAGGGEVVFLPRGDRILTCGSDGAIRFFSPATLVPVDSLDSSTSALNTLAVTQRGDAYAVGDSMHTVNLYAYPKTFDQQVTKLPGTVRSLAFSPRGNTIACGGDDVAVKIVNILDSTSKSLSGPTGSIRHLTYSPSGRNLAAIDSDGTLCIWTLNTETSHFHNQPTFSKKYSTERIDLSRYRQMGKCSWSPDDDILLLATPGTKDISIYTPDESGNNFIVSSVLKGGHSSAVSIVVFSPNGEYLASADDKRLCIWKVGEREDDEEGERLNDSGGYIVSQIELDEMLVGISWHPKQNMIAFLDEQGYIKKWEEPVPAHLAEINPPFNVTEEEPEINQSNEAEISTGTENALTEVQNIESSPTDIGPDPTKKTIRKAKSKYPLGADDLLSSTATSTNTLGSFVDTDEDALGVEDEDEESRVKAKEKDEEESSKRKRLKKAADIKETSRGGATQSVDDDGVVSDGDDMSDFIVDDTNGKYKDSADDYLSRKARAAALKSSNVTQATFQPSSTPFDPNTNRRYLYYSLIASILTHKQDVFHSIEIAFSDSTAHKPIKIRDHYGFTVGVVGEYGGLLCSPYLNVNRPAVLYYKAFQLWDSSADWTFFLPVPETVLAAAIGNKWVAVATDKGYMRVFTHTGIQRVIFSVPGSIITCAGNNSLLAYVYSINNTLMCVIYNIEHRLKQIETNVPLTAGSTLTWLSLTETGLLLSMDSTNTLRCLSRIWGYSWIPLYENESISKKNNAGYMGNSTYYWPIGIIENKLMSIMCKGVNKVPSTLNKPVLTAVNLNIPFIPVNGGEESKFEELYARNEIMIYESNHNNYMNSNNTNNNGFQLVLTPQQCAIQDKTLLQLYTPALNNDNSVRALDIVNMLQLSKSMDIALKLANHTRKSALSGRINVLVTAKRLEREKKERDEERKRHGSIPNDTDYTRTNNVIDSRKRSEPTPQPDEDEGEREIRYNRDGHKRLKKLATDENDRSKLSTNNNPISKDITSIGTSSSMDISEEDIIASPAHKKPRQKSEIELSLESDIIQDINDMTEDQSKPRVVLTATGTDFLNEYRRKLENEKKEKKEKEAALEKEKKEMKIKTSSKENQDENNSTPAPDDDDNDVEDTAEKKKVKKPSQAKNNKGKGKSKTTGAAATTNKEKKGVKKVQPKERESTQISSKSDIVSSSNISNDNSTDDLSAPVTAKKSLNPFAKSLTKDAATPKF